MELFEKFIFQNTISRFVIYYSGHGGDDSYGTNHVCEENVVIKQAYLRISLNGILTIWDNMRAISDSFSYEKCDLLFIIADCCHSGGWVDDHELQYRPYKYDSNGKRYHNVTSCGKYETFTG